MRLDKMALIIAILFLSFIFLFLPHTIELTGTLETWFPYKGLTLYKDIAMFHFPLGRFILFPFHLLSNWNLELDPFVGLGIGVLNLALIYYFGKKYLSKIATAISVIFFAIFFWFFATAILYFHEMLIGLLLTISIIILFDISNNSRVSFKKMFALGLFLSLVEFSGQIATPTVITLILLASFLIVKNKKKVKENFLLLIAGFSIPLAILFLYFSRQNALWEFIYWNTVYYFTYATSATPFTNLPMRELFIFYIPLILLFILVISKLVSKKKVPFEIFSILLLSASSILFVVHSIFHLHHLNYPLGILALSAGYSFDGLRTIKNGKAIFAIISVVFIFLGASTLLAWYSQRLSLPSLKIVNDVYPGDPMYDAVIWVKQNTNEDGRLMVVGDPLFYMRADRLPSTRPAKSIPYSWEPLEQIGPEIKATPPDYWVIDTNAIQRLIKVNSKQNMVDFINEELQSRYSKRAIFGNWEIWGRK